ncbi:MAG: protein-tyrosine phosphatase family protein [Chloroflexota bacterium]
MNPIVELPYSLPGRIYRGRMPFSAKDPDGQIFSRFQALGVSSVVLLAGREECLARSGRDLPTFYAEHGLDVIHLPIADFSVPDRDALSRAVDAALQRAWAGEHIAVHCFAGYGRTGMFLACLARRVFNMTAEAAILWVREYVPGAVEVAEQVEVVKRFC